MTARLQNAGILFVSALLLLSGCARISSQLYLRSYEGEIRKATRAIDAARDDAGRAAAYADRGSAYGEKARYLRTLKLAPADECTRIFELAIKDHDQAVALAPDNPEMYFRRGVTSYYIAALDPSGDASSRSFYAPARADFSRVIEKDPGNYRAFEMRGLVEEAAGERDKAIADYEHESALNPQGLLRLADAYCNRGTSYMRTKQYDLAAADLEKSIEIGSSTGGCECEPYNPLVGLYLEQKRDPGKARDLVRRAQNSRKWIAPEYLQKLQ